MIERPSWPLSDWEVRAILEGRKTQFLKRAGGVVAVHSRTGEALSRIDSAGPRVACHYGKPGDRIWGREAFVHPHHLVNPGVMTPECYRATNSAPSMLHWLAPLHMPREYSRILLEIVSVRVERLNDISEADAKAEGCQVQRAIYPDEPRSNNSYADQFLIMWEVAYGNSDRLENPFVWAIEFKRVEGGAA